MKLNYPKILILIFLFIFSFLTLYFTQRVSAINVWDIGGGGTYLQEENQAILSSPTGYDDKAFNYNQVSGTVDNMLCAVAGLCAAHKELMALSGGGAIGFTGNLISKLYIPPASSLEYFADLKQNLGLTDPVYAQGVGFSGLSPFLGIWKGFRNFAYLLIILFFVISGLMIMFRMKISPQAVISIQSALPRLVIALILITLSYAIAGLLIDFMYVVIYLLFSVFRVFAGVSTTNIENNWQNQSVFWFWAHGENLGWKAIADPSGAVGDMVSQIAGNGIGGWVAKAVSMTLGALIISIAVLWALFRLFFLLLKAYIWILVMVIFAPLQFLFFALPGGGGSIGFGGWLRGMLSNLAVFPLTIAMFLMASGLLAGFPEGGGASSGWVAPLIGGNSMATVRSLIALGIILMTPSVAKMASDAFKAPDFPYGAAIGQAVGAGPAIIGGAARRGLTYQSYELAEKGGVQVPRKVAWRSLFK